VSHDYYTVHPHRDEADLDLEADGDALAVQARLRNVAFLDGGKLPLDPDAVRRRARLSAPLWRRTWRLVSRKWRTSDDGGSLVNDDLLTEIERVRVYLEGRSIAGRMGNALRWAGKHEKDIAPRSLTDRSAIAPDREGNGFRNGTEKGMDGTREGAPGGLSSSQGKGPGPNPKNVPGLRMSKDGASCSYAGSWYLPNKDGHRWLTEDGARPDGSSMQSNPKDAALNERVYAAMNALAAKANP
jgi:hypothetical protein